MKALKVILSFVGLIIAVLTLNALAPHLGDVTLGGLIFTAPGGAATPFTFNMNYLPQFLTWNDAGNPLTSLRIQTQEDGVIHDYVAASLAVVNGYMMPGAQAANEVTIRIANGQLNPRNVTISGVTSAVGAIGFYEDSDKVGTAPFKVNTAQILALNPTTFTNFTAIWVPTMAAVTDTAEVTYRSGLKQTYNINGLTALSSYYQQVQRIMINNVNSYISSVRFTCAAATPAYVMSVKVPKV